MASNERRVSEALPTDLKGNSDVGRLDTKAEPMSYRGTPSELPRLRMSVDDGIATRVRQFRETCGVTQEELASKLNLPCEQIQQYERGKNRISAGAAYEIAQALDVPIAQIFEGGPIKQRVKSK